MPILALIAAAMVAGQSWKTDPHQIILHRQAGMAAPENTIPALENAVLQGADGIEIDIRKTADGEFVLYHDDWIYMQRGPGVRIEQLTLAQVAQIDVGERWGDRWRGLRTPLLTDVFEFAKSNRLLVFLDIKTQNIDADLHRLIAAHGVGDLVIVPDRFTSGKPNLPWISNWNYLDGGEESLDRMSQVVREQAKADKPVRIMADDARALAMALHRDPSKRKFIPYADSVASRLTALNPAPNEGEGRQSVRELLAEMSGAETADDRLQAAWNLGSLRSDEAVAGLKAWAMLADNPEPEKPTGGMPYFDTYRKAAACAALARIGSAEAMDALNEIGRHGGLFNREAAAIALSAFGEDDSILDYLRPDQPDSAALYALSHAYRHPLSTQIFLAGLKRQGMARRLSVFGLVWQEARAVPELEKLARTGALHEAEGAALALYWMTGEAASEARQRLQRASIAPEVKRVLAHPRPWAEKRG